MAQLLNATRFKSPAVAASTFTVTIPATTAGSKLVCVGGGGAIITAKLGVGGTSFTKRTTSLNNREVAAQDIMDASGGTTTIEMVLNGKENVDGMIYEFAAGSLGNFIAGAIQAGNVNAEGRALTGSVTTTGPSVLFTMFTADATLVSPASDCFWGLEPLGKQYANEHITTDPTLSKYWTMIGISDQASAGTFVAQSSRVAATGSHQSVVWAYENLAPGIPSYTNPYPNAIAAENSLPGTLTNIWRGAGTDPGIAGYTDSMSYTPGSTVNFKVDSLGAAFTVEVYRLGFYGHATFGGRKQVVLTGTPAAQPAPTINSYGGTVCAWSTTATWTVPGNATPGVYMFNMTAGANKAQGIFVVRSTVPASRADQIMVPTADFTWQAYNMWGATTNSGPSTSGYTGRNVYTQAPSGAGSSTRAFAVSYDRPMSTVSSNATTYFWDSEFALINFLEGNGYDIAYYSMVDIEKNPAIPSRYKVAVSHGHSEYWTTNLRDAYENARDSGTHLVFITGNTALWRVRFDAADANCRNLICYKDSLDTTGFDGVTKYDPVSYTGTWRDMRMNSGGVNNITRRPEPGMTGQWFIGNGPFDDTVVVPNTYRSLPMWRNTRVANSVSITVRGTSTASLTTPATTITINQPASTQAGDLLVLAMTFTGSPGSISNAPFRIIRVQTAASAPNQTTIIAVGYALVAGSSAHAINWTAAGALNVSVAMVAYGNAVWEDVDTSLLLDTSGSTTHTTASISNGGTNRWAVCVFGDATTNGSARTTAWTAGSGLTSRATTNNSASGAGPWCSTSIMDTNSAVTQGSHQYSATANFANPVAFAGIIYISPGVPLAKRTIGREWDYVKRDEPSTPSNLIMLSRQAFQLRGQAAKYNGDSYGEYGLFQYGMTLYQAASGALVFNAGSWRYSFGLSRFREGTFDASGDVDVAMQQSVINLLKDMGIAPGGLLSTVANVDSTPLVDPGTAASAAAYGFPVAAAATQYQTIFRSTPPIIYDAADNTDYTLGTVFTASVNGEIHGIRWHFPGQMPHVPVIGLLYSWSSDSSGTELARATFANTQSGWNSVMFASPVAISAGSKYVAAVWTKDRYVSIAGQFASSGVSTGDLTAVQDTAGAHNGKLQAAYANPAYPESSFGSNGYLVDVLFVGKGFEGWGIPL